MLHCLNCGADQPHGHPLTVCYSCRMPGMLQEKHGIEQSKTPGGNPLPSAHACENCGEQFGQQLPERCPVCRMAVRQAQAAATKNHGAERAATVVGEAKSDVVSIRFLLDQRSR